MLFRRDIEPSCSCCVHGSGIDEISVICVKKGIVKAWDSCRRFEYDPLKRIPEASSEINVSGLSEEDFRLD